MTPAHRADGRRNVVWAAGLIVALGAGVATAHGLYEVALAAGVPAVIAWLYPLITDGLALVAYAATARLTSRGRGYAWTVVVLAAGLSGLGQASYLAGGVAAAPTGLRFGVGAWPAIAAAIVAHLVYLLGSHDSSAQPERSTTGRSTQLYNQAVQPAVQPDTAAVQPSSVQPYNPPALNSPVQPSARPTEQSDAPAPVGVRRQGAERGGTPARERARVAARSHHARQGELPSVSQLVEAASVARGTAQAVLKQLRHERAQLHVVHGTDESRTD